MQLVEYNTSNLSTHLTHTHLLLLCSRKLKAVKSLYHLSFLFHFDETNIYHPYTGRKNCNAIVHIIITAKIYAQASAVIPPGIACSPSTILICIAVKWLKGTPVKGGISLAMRKENRRKEDVYVSKLILLSCIMLFHVLFNINKEINWSTTYHEKISLSNLSFVTFDPLLINEIMTTVRIKSILSHFHKFMTYPWQINPQISSWK